LLKGQLVPKKYAVRLKKTKILKNLHKKSSKIKRLMISFLVHGEAFYYGGSGSKAHFKS
jgi:hypothetical protein